MLALAQAVLRGEKSGHDLLAYLDRQPEPRVVNYCGPDEIEDAQEEADQAHVESLLGYSDDDDPELLLHEADCARDLLYTVTAEYERYREHGHGILGAYYAVLDARLGETNLPSLQEVLDLRVELGRKAV